MLGGPGLAGIAAWPSNAAVASVVHVVAEMNRAIGEMVDV